MARSEYFKLKPGDVSSRTVGLYQLKKGPSENVIVDGVLSKSDELKWEFVREFCFNELHHEQKDAIREHGRYIDSAGRLLQHQIASRSAILLPALAYGKRIRSLISPTSGGAQIVHHRKSVSEKPLCFMQAAPGEPSALATVGYWFSETVWLMLPPALPDHDAALPIPIAICNAGNSV